MSETTICRNKDTVGAVGWILDDVCMWIKAEKICGIDEKPCDCKKIVFELDKQLKDKEEK